VPINNYMFFIIVVGFSQIMSMVFYQKMISAYKKMISLIVKIIYYMFLKKNYLLFENNLY